MVLELFLEPLDLITKHLQLITLSTNTLLCQKFSQTITKISVNTHLSLTVWRQNGATNKGAKRKKGRNSLELRPGNYLFHLTILLRGQNLNLRSSGYEPDDTPLP